MTTTEEVYASRAFAYLQQGMKDREAFAIVMAVNGRGHDPWTSFERWATEQLERQKDEEQIAESMRVEFAERTFEAYQRAVVSLHTKLFHDDPTDIKERIDRFAEEAIELCQAFGMSRGDLHALIEYSFGRPQGEPEQEVGGVITTLASLVQEAGFNFEALAVAGLHELRDKIPKIRAKRATRHGRGPLPGFDPVSSGLYTAESKQGHVLYRTGDADAPDSIKDQNNEVVLGLCKQCGGAEGELSEPCCNPVKITDDEATLGDNEAVRRVPRYDHNPPVPEPVSLHHENTLIDAPVLDDSGTASAGFTPPLAGFTPAQLLAALKQATVDQLRRELFDRGIVT